MSARFGEGLAAAILLRMKRRADDTAARLTPEPEPPRPPALLLEDEREPDALDLIDDEDAEVAPEPGAIVKPAPRCRKCGYLKGSRNCLIMCGGG